MTIEILNQPAEKMSEIDQTFDLVYMDPPFGLQRDFSMLEEDGQEKSFSDHWDSFDDYIEWYANIITLAYDRLNDNGWIYLHNNFIGNALVLSKLDSKIRDSFYTNISWKRSGPKNNIKNGWGNIVDSIMVLQKGKPYFDVQYVPLDPKYAENSFKNKDEVGFYALAKVTGEKSRPCKRYEYKGYNPEYGFRISIDKLTALDESKGVPIQNFWDDVYFISRSEKNKRKYPTQKPIKLLERIIKSSCPVGGWVLDPFCGSGTTAIAASNLNINCITTDVNPDAISIAEQSIKELSNPLLDALT